MDKEYRDSSCQNLDGKVKLWEFTFLGDTNDIESEENNNDVKVNDISQLSVVETNFPLTKARRGDRLNIVKINALADMARRLQKMGLLPGVEIEVISNNPSGSVIVALNHHHIGLGSNPASKIMVSSTDH
ncbi:MAG: FeoA family protein [Microcoleaceae cyanobacterium]